MGPRRQGRGRSLLCVLYAAALLLPGLLGAQSPRQTSAQSERQGGGRPVSQITADRFIDRVVDGEPITFLYGNVFIDRDTLKARSDTALYYRRQQVYEFRGNVRLRQHGATLTCRYAVYRRSEEDADFFGDVRVEEANAIGTAARGESRLAGNLLRLIEGARLVSPDYTVWADTIERDRFTERGEASGHVKIVDPAARTLVTGEHAVFAGDGSSARVDRDPVLTSRERGQETFEGRSRVMHFYRDDQRVVMIDSVRIVQGRTRAAADTAFVYGEERLLLRGSPRVRVGEQSSLTAREIEFLYRDQQLHRIILRGQARMEDSTPDSLAAIYRGLPALDVLDGDTITVEIADDQVQRSTVLGHAHSLYVPADVTDEVAYNDVHGDTIIIHFREEKVDRVNVRGNMVGTYTFARVAELRREGGSAWSDSSVAIAVPAGHDTTSTGNPLFSAFPGGADSLLTVADTSAVLADTLAVVSTDTLALPAAAGATYDFQSGVEVVDYSGGEVLFRLADRRIEIEREAELIYGTMTLTAAAVTFDTIERELYASGEPLLVDQDQKITGEKMGYNFEFRTAAVRDGVTSYDRNFYDGKEIKRFADGSLKILSGKMTACDLEEPHYHFWSNKMKIRLKDKVVAKPVVLKIGRVPLFALPFYFKSLETGRRSGILFPNFNFGWSSRTGRYIRDFGYYWATNDYTDFVFEGDYNERRDFTYRVRNRYVKRYSFNGSLAYTRQLSFGENPEAKEWQLRWHHKQNKLFDVYNLTASVEMASRTLASNNLSNDVGRDIVSGQLHSTVYLSRSWSFMSGNLNLTRDEFVNAADDDLTTDNKIYTQTLPSLSLSLRRRSILPPLKPGQKGSFLGDLLRDTYYNLGTSFKSAKTQNELTAIQTYNASGNLKVDIQPPRIGIFSLSTGVSTKQSWQRVDTTGVRYEVVADTLTGNVVTLDGRRETTSPGLSVNSSLRTTLYGLFPLRLGRLRGLRHTLRFSVGHAWRPSLGEKQRQSESFSFSLGNRFDLKYLKGSESDSTAEIGKLDGLLDWSLSTSYNPQAEPAQRWADIGSSIAIKPGRSRHLNFKVNNSIDPYEWKILSTRFTYGLNLQGRLDTGGSEELIEPPRNQAIERLGVSADSTVVGTEGLVVEEDEEDDPFGDEFAGFERPGHPERPGADSSDPTEGSRYIPWNMSVSLSYNRNNVRNTSSARGNLSLSANLSRYWEFSYRGSFDFDQGRILNQHWTLKRDLHCWALEFTRSVYTNNQEFGFRLYLKSIPALKVARGKEDLLGTAGQFSGGIF